MQEIARRVTQFIVSSPGRIDVAKRRERRNPPGGVCLTSPRRVGARNHHQPLSVLTPDAVRTGHLPCLRVDRHVRVTRAMLVSISLPRASPMSASGRYSAVRTTDGGTSMNSTARLEELADAIATRPSPLGSDFSSECWGAVAKRIADDRGVDPCEYFGFSPGLYRALIRTNRELPEGQRNDVMLAFTRALADMSPTTSV
jgi:hypothetical protein